MGRLKEALWALALLAPAITIPPALAADAGTGYSAAAPGSVTVERPPEAGRARPLLTLPSIDWKAAGKAEGIAKPEDEGLAGDPNKVTLRLRPSPADEDSYFNSLEYQQKMMRGMRGRQGAGDQFEGLGEAMAGAAALKLLDGVELKAGAGE